MKISELKNHLDRLLELHGDLEVGCLDLEYGCYYALRENDPPHVRQRQALGDVTFHDDPELGEKFIAL